MPAFERALITGASSGIGEALTRLLSKQGIRLILAGRNTSRLEALAREVQAEEVVTADLNQKSERRKLIEVIRKKSPDLVINNAGFGIYGDPLTLSVEEQLSILEVNAAAPFELTLEAVRALLAAGKKGVILNVSSVAGELPTPGMSAYGASKAFLTKVSEGMNTELAETGIHVLVNCPGMVATDFANRAAKKKVSVTGGPVMTPEFAAHEIWKQIQQKKGKRVINWRYRFALFMTTYLIPASVVKKKIWNQIKQRI